MGCGDTRMLTALWMFPEVYSISSLISVCMTGEANEVQELGFPLELFG